MSNAIHTFVGREEEQAQWLELLADPAGAGKAVVVVGKYGMGKTWLLDRLVELAQNLNGHDRLECVALRYSVAPSESPGMVMKMLLEDAFQAARCEAGSLSSDGKRFVQWNRLYRLLGLFSPSQEIDYSFLHALRYDPRKNIFEQFILRLRALAEHLPENGRLLVAVDPVEDTPAIRVEQWSRIVENLPPKVVFLFAQRYNDTLAIDERFRSLPNVHFLSSLGDLSETDTLRLMEAYQPVIERRGFDHGKLLEIFRAYRNHPYAVHAALNLLLCEKITSPEQLPKEPMPECVAPIQWEQIVKHPLSRDAVQIFEAYCVLEVPSLDEMVCWVADVSQEALDAVLADPFLRSLIRDEADGRLVYHHYLNHYIRSLLYAPDGGLTLEAERLHQRAMIGYGDLMQRAIKPDPLATIRFPEHSLAVGGAELYAEAIGRSADAFLALGFHQTLGAVIERALGMISPQSGEASDLYFQLGRLRNRQDDFEAARESFEKSLQIARKIVEPERIAQALYALGKLDFEQHRDEDAVANLTEASIYLRADKPGPVLVEVLVLLGDTLWRQEETDRGEAVLNEAVNVAKRIRNYRQQSRAMAVVFTTWGRIFDDNGDTAHAAELFHKAIDLTQDIYDRESEAEIRTKLGTMLQRTGDLETAEKNLARAMEIHEDLKQIEHWAEDCHRLALLARKQGKSDLERQRRLQARQLYQQLGNLQKLDEIDEETRRSSIDG